MMMTKSALCKFSALLALLMASTTTGLVPVSNVKAKNDVQNDRRFFVQSASLVGVSWLLMPAQSALAVVTEFQKVLVPVVQISNELQDIKTLVRDKTGWSKALSLLQDPKYEKANFKKTFNQVGDNFAGNSSSGGGAPKQEQSVAYLIRNEVLTNVEDLLAELEYLSKNKEEDVADLYQYADSAASAMERYLGLIPLSEIDQVQLALK